jgi:multisubunit Na+/H+ antiporter MnhB subunit
VSTFGDRCIALRITPGKPSSDFRGNFLRNQIIHAAVSILVLLLGLSALAHRLSDYSLSNWLPSYGGLHFSAAPQASE